MDDISATVPQPCGKFVVVGVRRSDHKKTNQAFCRSMTLKEIQASCFIDSSATTTASVQHSNQILSLQISGLVIKGQKTSHEVQQQCRSSGKREPKTRKER
jgi:hypothetical protein